MNRTNFQMQEQNIALVRGDTLCFNIVMYGEIQSLDAVYFTVKKTINGENVFQKSIGDGVDLISEGIYAVRVAPEDTAELEIGQYYYDCEIQDGSDRYTLTRGIFDLLYDITTEV